MFYLDFKILKLDYRVKNTFNLVYKFETKWTFRAVNHKITFLLYNLCNKRKQFAQNLCIFLGLARSIDSSN